jgi:hypothetical protein
MRLTRVLRWLLGFAIALPMLVLLLQFAGRLLAVMGDEPGGSVLRTLAVSAGILWAVILLGLVIVVAVELIARDEPPGPTRRGRP